MSQNQEIIESKLCAYIDGELDPEGRSEIEKHLEANPQHRRLLESLRATRDLLRWLPREPAPPELAETLNGQLERSVLLDYENDDSLRPTAWPRIFAAAAIVALTSGLFIAVFYALPRSQKPTLAIHAPVAGGSDSRKDAGSEHFFGIQPSAVPSVSTDLGDANLRDGADTHQVPAHAIATESAKAGNDESQKMVRDQKELAIADMKQMPAVVSAGSLGGENTVKGSDDLEELARQVAQNPEVFNSASSNATASPSQPAPTPTPVPAGNAMVMLVRSDAPERAEKQLTTYLDSQQLQWRQTQLPASQTAANLPYQAADLPTNSKGSNVNNELRQDQEFVKKEADSTLNFKSENENIARNSAKTGVFDGMARKTGNSAKGNFDGAVTQPAPSDPSAAQLAVNPAPSAPASPREQRAQILTKAASDASQIVENAAKNSYRSNGVYVVQMSRRQAAALTTCISREGVQAAELKDIAAPPYGASGDASPRNQQLAENQSPSPEAAYGGGHQLGLPATNRAYRDREVSQVVGAAGNGNRLWGLSAGASIEGKNSSTTQRTDSLQADRVVDAAKPTSAPLAAATPSPQTEPSNIFARLLSSTQPTTDKNAFATTAPADEPVNLVIMIEGNSSNPAPAASQPAGPSQQLEPPAAAQKAYNAK